MESLSQKYYSAFQDWDDKSWVRSKPHRDVETSFDNKLKFFSEKLAFLFKHIDIQKQSQDIKDKLLVYHLYNYIEFTVFLEMGPVNEVCNLIRLPTFLPWLPSNMKEDAFKIYVDEAGHAEMAHSLRASVTKYTGLPPLKFKPAFLTSLEEIIKNEPSELLNLIKVFFVIISETLITGTLIFLPTDETVQIAVRDFAKDHALDEGKHHAYFRQLFEYIYPRFPTAMKVKIGKLLPKMIYSFLKPEYELFFKILKEFPDNFSHPAKIIEDLKQDEIIRDGIKSSAEPTIKMLRNNGIFEYNEINEAFKEYQLI